MILPAILLILAAAPTSPLADIGPAPPTVR